ncbi:MAG: metal dependent phosphohydrolase [Gammaproteobacteria bacterium]|nr:MAG: metal dependent phosphohydrolase [Gammaproteobacteria bacterium]TND06190.1 MAG: metal dependent phosphohydrolase [Gammaproteobacteria bacterium]
MASSPEALVRGAKTVSSLPTTFTQLNTAVEDPRSSNRDIAGIISDDAGLSARLLRMVNSALYAFPSKISTISRAVTVVGTKQLRDLALATSVLDMFRDVPSDQVNMESFWKHNIACGVTARVLATMRRDPNAEEYFVSGLLHDIGRLLMFTEAPELAAQAFGKARESQTLLYKNEQEVFGFDHAAVGAVLLKQWQLPAQIVAAVGYHHRPSANRDHPIHAAITHVADLIVNAQQIGTSGEVFTPPLDVDAWKKLGLQENMLSAIIKQANRQIDDAAPLLLEAA